MSLPPPLSLPAPPKKIPILSLSDNEPDPEESFSESSDSDSSDGGFLNFKNVQALWEIESLAKLSLACASTPNDSKFDRLDNKLLSALKEFSTTNEMFCFKCKGMKLMTKKGKTSNTYQFHCEKHTLSATQILGTLPDAFFLRNLPTEPRDVFNATITWLGKDHLSPELQELSCKRNAVKRFSAHRSPPKPESSSLLSSRNVVNEMLVELRDLKERVTTNERALTLQNVANLKLAEANAGLTEQIKLLKEENAILKNYLNTSSPIKKSHHTNTSPSKATSSSSYAVVSDIIKPMNKTMRFYTQASSKGPIPPYEVISAAAPAKPPTPKEDFSPLKVVVFKGCHRKSISTYKTMLPTIGFETHWARHVVFLAEEIIQITTFECKADLLIKGMQSISPEVKHLPNFNPFAGSSYSDYGTFTDESASKSYLSLMSKCAAKLQADCKRTPSLRRIAFFLAKLVESKSINFDPAPRPTRVFCLGDFIVKKEPAATAMEIEIPASTTAEIMEPVIEPVQDVEAAAEQTPESDSDATMKETSSTADDQ